MSEYLRTHPDVLFSSYKEPNFFNTDFSEKKRKVHTEGEYFKLFEGAEKYYAVGEGTTRYLSSKDAIPNILKFNSDAKFVVMLRNPVDLFHSLYWEYRKSLQEDARTPEEAWGLQETRRKGERIPPKCPDPQLLQYGKVCMLGEQLERLYRLVPRKNVLVIFYDDFKNNAAASYEEVLKFLGLRRDKRTDFPAINRRKTHISRTLLRFIYMLGDLKKKVGIYKSFGVLETIKKKNIKHITPPPLSESFRQELRDYFKEDTQRLSEITNRDLSCWDK